MLRSLLIKNVALFEQCKVDLGEGLNVLTGETGAGKSIVIDSLNFVLGARSDKSLIRYGASSATVEGVFEVEDNMFDLFDELGLERDNTLIIRRTMSDNRNDIKVNGDTFSLNMLRKLTAPLVDILGQHEHQSLLKPSSHLGLLDKYDESISIKKKAFAEVYAEYKAQKTELDAFGDEASRLRRKETLEYQIEDIKKVDPKVDEEDELLKTREKFRNAEKLIEGVGGAYNALDSEEIGVGALIARAIQSLRPVAKYDDDLQELNSRLESAKIELEDIRDTLYDYIESSSFDERMADRIERRVDAIKLLKRKYGATVQDVLDFLEKMESEYSDLERAEDRIEELTKAHKKTKELLFTKVIELSDARRAAAKKFESAIVKELADLAMKGTKFEVEFNDKPSMLDFEDQLQESGVDQVEFMISPNVGEPLRSLSKIASGGEMSRFMLAIKNIIADLDNIETMVFDEIDTGISGNVAETVAQKLYNISVGRQVIAVTHLPQLASFADNHYLISKSVVNEKTVTQVTPLDVSARVGEVARLAGADTQAAQIHAKEMIKRADIYKATKNKK